MGLSGRFLLKLQVIDNPPNPYVSRHAEWLESPPLAEVEVFEDASRSILSKNDSSDLPFTWSANPYRGCQHACSYCYARRTHEYLGLGAGTDFDTKIMVKPKAPYWLRQAFSKANWKREWVNFSGVTDCYQPLEASYEITRRCLEVCLAMNNPAMVVTKGFLVVRDADILAKLNDRVGAQVYISIPFADAAQAKLIEPQAPPPQRRYEAIRRLREAGVPVGVMVSPMIPGLTDYQIPEILERSAQAGAQLATQSALRLPGNVEAVFLSRLAKVMPDRVKKITSRLREIRGGKLSDSRVGMRIRGSGAYWDSVRDLFELHRKRLGLDKEAKTRPTHKMENLGTVGNGSQMVLNFFN